MFPFVQHLIHHLLRCVGLAAVPRVQAPAQAESLSESEAVERFEEHCREHKD